MSVSSKEAWSDFRVGLVTFTTLFVLIAGLVFAGGEKGILFKQTVSLKGYMPDVGGLKRGSAVTMGGMSIGQVNAIEFAPVNNPEPVEITMEIRSDLRGWIKEDSIPSVRTQGMLGDRYVDLSLGSEKAAVLPEGGYLVGDSASNFDATLARATNVLSETEKMLRAVNKQKGTAGKFLYDEQFYSKLISLTEELNTLIKDVKENPRRYLKFSVF